MSAVCVFFMRGTCRFGHRCWNSHDLGSGRSNSPLQQQETSDDESLPRRESTSIQTASPSSSTSRTRPVVRQVHSASAQAQKPQKNQTESKNLWFLTNSSSAESNEGTFDTILVETVKRLNESENLVTHLRQQLNIKNEGGNFSWVTQQMEQCIESDLQCNICYEIFIKPTVLNCTHTFCHDCIESWTRRVNHCPTCRVYVKSKVHCLTLDAFLDKTTECLSEEIKLRRESLKVERNNNRVANRNPRSQARRQYTRHHRNQTMRRSLGMLWGDRDPEGADWNLTLEDTLFDPIRLGDVLGRNRNDRDDWDDDLSDNSLDSNYEYGYRFCTYCDNVGHSASNCPLFIMEESGQLI